MQWGVYNAPPNPVGFRGGNSRVKVGKGDRKWGRNGRRKEGKEGKGVEEKIEFGLEPSPAPKLKFLVTSLAYTCIIHNTHR